jgi:hypothetical protein
MSQQVMLTGRSGSQDSRVSLAQLGSGGGGGCTCILLLQGNPEKYFALKMGILKTIYNNVVSGNI